MAVGPPRVVVRSAAAPACAPRPIDRRRIAASSVVPQRSVLPPSSVKAAGASGHDRLSGMSCRSSERGRLTLGPDAVSEVLQDLRLAGAGSERFEVTGPWGLAVPPGSGARLHLVL